MSNELGTGDERNNENRRHVGKVAIDKGIRPVEIAADNDMPPGILSMKPLATMPTTARSFNSPTNGGPGPRFQGQPGNQPSPGARGISPNVEAELPKLSDDKAQRVRDVVSRKAVR